MVKAEIGDQRFYLLWLQSIRINFIAVPHVDRIGLIRVRGKRMMFFHCYISWLVVVEANV